MCMRIMARNNGHQRALNQLNKCFFAYFICGTALTCPLDNSQRGNIWCARITQLSTDFWYLLYIIRSNFALTHCVDLLDPLRLSTHDLNRRSLARLAWRDRVVWWRGQRLPLPPGPEDRSMSLLWSRKDSPERTKKPELTKICTFTHLPPLARAKMCGRGVFSAPKLGAAADSLLLLCPLSGSPPLAPRSRLGFWPIFKHGGRRGRLVSERLGHSHCRIENDNPDRRLQKNSSDSLSKKR